jgi:hypothetical protein
MGSAIAEVNGRHRHFTTTMRIRVRRHHRAQVRGHLRFAAGQAIRVVRKQSRLENSGYNGLLMPDTSKTATALVGMILLGSGCTSRHPASGSVPAPPGPPLTPPVHIELVLDRSASMQAAMPAMLGEAATMVASFRPGRDRLGLVVFGSSALVAYPADGSGPSADFKSSRPSMPDVIYTINAGSNTGTAEALWLAYRELAKQPDPRARHLIVLFTDGLPNGITADLNDPDPARNLLRRDSRCLHKNEPGFPMRAVIAQTCGYRMECGGGIMLWQPLQGFTDAQHPNAAAWLHALPPTLPIGPETAGCSFQEMRGAMGRDIRALPTRDVYGNATDGDGYRDSLLFAKEGVPLDLTRVTSGYQIGLASWNAADDAARRIRQDRDLRVAIFVIGYMGIGAASDAPDMRLMHRMANVNVPGNNAFDPEAPRGAIVSGGDLRALFANLYAVVKEGRR